MPDQNPFLDHPIRSGDEDTLGFREVAQTLVDAIAAQSNETSLTLGLDGTWGSGKTSILHLMQEIIDSERSNRTETKEVRNSIGPVIVTFSPWLVTNRTALITSFFKQVSTALEEAERRAEKPLLPTEYTNKKKLETARQRLNKFSGIVSTMAAAALPIDPTMIAATLTAGSMAVRKLSTSNGPTLEETKQQLSDLLAEVAKDDPSFRILVLIDDLDRIEPSEALEVLRLVKAVADFPATTYLLAYDKTELSHAISQNISGQNGDVYLEKIVQFSFKVPPLEPFQLRTWLRREIETHFPQQTTRHRDRSDTVVGIWAGKLLKTPREVKRLLFAVKAIWSKLDGQIDLLDLVWLQMIAQKASSPEANMYSWVIEYLQGLDAIAIGGNVTGTDKDLRDMETIFSTLGWQKYQKDHGLSFDLHSLDTILAGVTSNHLGDSDANIYQVTQNDFQKFRREKRLSSPWHWRLYFALQAPSHAISDAEWTTLDDAAQSSEAALIDSVSKLLEISDPTQRNITDQILERSIHLLEGSNLRHPERWLIALMESSDKLQIFSRPDCFLGHQKIIHHRITPFFKGALSILAPEAREELLTKVFAEEKYLTLTAIILRDLIRLAQDTQNDLFVTNDELETAKKLQLSLLRDMSGEQFRKLLNPYETLYLWKDITGSFDEPGEFLSTNMKTDNDFIETLAALKTINNSSQNGIPRITESNLGNFCKTDEVKLRLRSLAASDSTYKQGATNLLALWWSAENDG